MRENLLKHLSISANQPADHESKREMKRTLIILAWEGARCKACGGPIAVGEGTGVSACEKCGAPWKEEDEQGDRANRRPVEKLDFMKEPEIPDTQWQKEGINMQGEDFRYVYRLIAYKVWQHEKYLREVESGERPPAANYKIINPVRKDKP